MSSEFIDIDMINTESGAVECAGVICVVADRFAKISASALGVIEPCSMPTVIMFSGSYLRLIMGAFYLVIQWF